MSWMLGVEKSFNQRHTNEKVKKKLTEKQKVQIAIDVCESWLDPQHLLVKATSTYQHWQHDKHSLAYGWIQGVKAVQGKLYELRDRE